ncbi:MAG TPA: YqeG family HAD IIIA-type phosphatase [Clostridiales bacterium]|jgi:HAD superfamily phosphatase (TIGR01668 family)|nr:YqeG family HAD IIIA-type phosphatase [Clostridiales bacterium]
MGLISRFFWPDIRFKNIYEITPQLLSDCGIRAVISDIDNTLVTYDDPSPTPEVRRWLKSMEDAGIKFAFVSNNSRERVETFCEGMDCCFFADCGKPSPKHILEALRQMGEDKANAALLGDQLFTDVLAGKLAGIRTILVDPIKDVMTPPFRFKRALEKPILAAYERHISKNRKKG